MTAQEARSITNRVRPAIYGAARAQVLEIIRAAAIDGRTSITIKLEDLDKLVTLGTVTEGMIEAITDELKADGFKVVLSTRDRFMIYW